MNNIRVQSIPAPGVSPTGPVSNSPTSIVRSTAPQVRAGSLRLGNPAIVLSRDPKNLFEPMHFQAFASDVPQGSPATPDLLNPDRIFNPEVYSGLMVQMPDGQLVEFWGFFDSTTPLVRTFPSSTIRVVEGEIFHGHLTRHKNTHTIHWHGMEPTAMNDGVGKLSFEVSGGAGYTYQMLAGAAGTYFYHCHKNTLLHFEMGMYGMLIIDPPGKGGPFVDGGPGWVRRGNDIVPYDVEAIWVSDDVDPRWHIIGAADHSAGFPLPGTTLMAYNDPQNPHFDNFSPRYFLITGRPHPWSRNLPGNQVDSGVAATVRVGQTLLVRLLCAAYSLNKYTISGLNAEVIAMDGRVLGQDPYTKYSRPFTIAAGVPFELTAARRFDLLIKPTARDIGSHRVAVEFHHHINQEQMGIAETFIHVVP
ncbi:MAG: multicopper oxidase domain-containing protein [Deltaproteobacteria bacterium]|nr:multicopper oxidase domain-containing protein [Deltaproteobacteria bacterium]